MKCLYFLMAIGLLSANVPAQSKIMGEVEVRETVNRAVDKGERVTFKLKAAIPARTNGWGKKQLSKISGKVVEVQDSLFIVEDKSLLLGDVKATVYLSDVVWVKRQPKLVRGLQKTGEVAAVGTIAAAVTPPLLGAYILHFVSGGKIILWGMAPK